MREWIFNYFCRMKEDILQALEKILLPLSSGWSLEQVTTDENKEEVYVKLRYTNSEVFVEDEPYAIYDFRHERQWRHLDLWHYKTYIIARIPRFKDTEGVKTMEVPWADHHERISWRLEKKR